MRQTPGAQRPPRALSSQRSPARGPAGTRHHAQGAGHPLHPQNGGWGGGDPLFIPPPSAPERLYPQLHCRGNHLPSPWQLTQSPPPPPASPPPPAGTPTPGCPVGAGGAQGSPGQVGAVPSATSLPVTVVCPVSPPRASRGGEQMAGPPWWGRGVPAPQGVPQALPPPVSQFPRRPPAGTSLGWRDRGDRGPDMEGDGRTGGGTRGDVGGGEEWGTIGREGRRRGVGARKEGGRWRDGREEEDRGVGDKGEEGRGRMERWLEGKGGRDGRREGQGTMADRGTAEEGTGDRGLKGSRLKGRPRWVVEGQQKKG